MFKFLRRMQEALATFVFFPPVNPKVEQNRNKTVEEALREDWAKIGSDFSSVGKDINKAIEQAEQELKR